MKLLLSAIGIACLLSFKTLEEVNRNTLEISSNYSECKYNQCQATAKSTGNQCKHCVSNSGDSFCYQHD